MKKGDKGKETARTKTSKSYFGKEDLGELQPKNYILLWLGGYIIVTSLLTICIVDNTVTTYWSILQLMIGICYIHSVILNKKYNSVVTRWVYIASLNFCLLTNITWHWWHVTNPLFVLTLSLMHLSITLVILPIFIAIYLVISSLLISFYPIYSIGLPLLLQENTAPLRIFSLGLLLFAIIIYHKFQIRSYKKLTSYLRHQNGLKKSQQVQNIAYVLSAYFPTSHNNLGNDITALQQLINSITNSIAFSNNTPLYKQDFQCIVNKFSEWAAFLKQQSKSKKHMLLLPNAISIDLLIYKLEETLESGGYMLRLLVEKKPTPNGIIPDKIICDVNITIRLLSMAILRIANSDQDNQLIRVELYSTYLRYKKSDPITDASPLSMLFPAIAIVISPARKSIDNISYIIQNFYEYFKEKKGPKHHPANILPDQIDISKKNIERIVNTHYGYLEILEDKESMLLVLPCNVVNIRNEMLAKLPIDCLTSEAPITPKEEAKSMMDLIEFHDYACQISEVDSKIITEILLLLKYCYKFKRHPSGQLFYIRSVGIARLVAQWIFHSPRAIYAALLYDLVRYTYLPISYIKANYNIGVFYFVQNILGLDKQQKLSKSLFYINNRFKQAINHSQLSVFYIKLAERLYDLRYFENYTCLEEVKYMAQETLAIDVYLAELYLDPDLNIAGRLKIAAENALQYCNKNSKHSNKTYF